MALRDVLAERGLGWEHMLDLLEAFRRDVDQAALRDWDELMDYCRYSAAPVGRFVLDVHGEDRATWPANDALCAALQVINHLQDCAKDYHEIDRVYLPRDVLEACGANVEMLAEDASDPGPERGDQPAGGADARAARHLAAVRRRDRRPAPGAGGRRDPAAGREPHAAPARPRSAVEEPTTAAWRRSASACWASAARWPSAWPLGFRAPPGHKRRRWTPQSPTPEHGASTEQQAAGSSFYAAMRLLPPAERAAMFAIYAFCRVVDDIADDDRARAERAPGSARPLARRRRRRSSPARPRRPGRVS